MDFEFLANRLLEKAFPGAFKPVVPGIFSCQVLTEAEASDVAHWALNCPGWTDWTRPETFDTPGIRAAYPKGHDMKNHIAKRRYNDLPFGNIPKKNFDLRTWKAKVNPAFSTLVGRGGFSPLRWLDPFITRFERDGKGSRSYVPTHRDGFCTTSMVLQIPKEGGGTYFPNIKLFVPDKLGQLLLFGGDNYYGRKMPYMAHRTKPVTKGTRLSLICFFDTVQLPVGRPPTR